MSNSNFQPSDAPATNAADSPKFDETLVLDAVLIDPDTTGPHQKPDRLLPDLNTTGPHQGN